MGFLQKINAVWQKIGIVQRAMLVSIVMACVIIGGLLTKWATTADMQLLYSNLSVEEAGKIVDKLGEQNIPYELKGNGTSIYVSKNKYRQIRLDLAKEGLPGADKEGRVRFDNQGPGVSPMVQKLNAQWALQDEIQNTIKQIDGVQSAKVHIAHSDKVGILATDKEDTTAAVFIVMKPGWSLNQSNVAAITHLVASATEGLLAENVTVTDSRQGLLTKAGGGNEIIGMGGTYNDLKTGIEARKNEQIRLALERYLGPGRVQILSSVELDMTSKSTVKTTYEKGIPSKEIIDSTTTTKDSVQDDKGNTATAGTNDKTETINTEYRTPETTVTEKIVPGKIISWSISAIVDLYKPEPPAPEGEEAEAAAAAPAAGTVPELIMTVEDVEAIIKSAIGGEQMLADPKALTVTNVRSYRPPMADIAAAESASYERLARYIEIARQSSLGVLAICALLVLRIFTKAAKKTAAETPAAAAGQLSMGGMGLLPAGGEGIDAYRQHINGELKQNPEQVKQLFASWLSEGN